MANLSPLDPMFWDAEFSALRGSLGPSLLTILFSGAMSGSQLLPKGADILVDWDWFNQAAVDWVNGPGLEWLDQVNQTTARQAGRIIEGWIRTGQPLDVLKEQLRPVFGPGRAERIAITEVTRAYAEGNLMTWRSTGVVDGKRWNTAVDEKVCPICWPLNGMVVKMGEAFSIDAADRAAGLGITAPPAHPRCRCWLTPVVSGEALKNRIDQVLRAGR